MLGDDDTLDVVLVTQLPPDSWFEGFAIRPNNHILAARLDLPVVYDIDAEDPDTEPVPVYEFPGVAAALNLCAIPGRSDEYSVITSQVSDIAQSRWEGFAVWYLDLRIAGAPKAKRMGNINDIALPLGLCPVTARFILVADSAKSCIQCLDVTTGKSSVFLADEKSMVPNGEDAFFGVNRMCLVGGYLWYSNYSAGTIHRVACELAEGKANMPLRTTGPVEVIADDLRHCDGFQIRPDGSVAYTLNWNDGSLVKTDLENMVDGKAQSKPFLDRLVNPTCIELSVGSNDRPKLFVICCGEIDVGWINNTMSWNDIANITAATVQTIITTA
ncbi:hypothetical protein SCAR479_05205 [Seiridium cardinale]|uniref:Uncharacterized protein n=1 Tax=Seiridium cardinale TaxID=138064 RepID=A0ABR2XX33_9PEZI